MMMVMIIMMMTVQTHSVSTIEIIIL